MRRRKVLYVLHNHPTERPGGAEVYALELYEAMLESNIFEPFLLARAETRLPRMTSLAPAPSTDAQQYLLYTAGREFDHLEGTSRRGAPFRRDFTRFLNALRPEIVHFHHTLFLGYDLVSDARRILPSAGIVYTLHDFHPICARDGQMVRTRANELCDHASPARCHECFPDVSPERFEERATRVKRHLQSVDVFVAPSDFLRERYVAWGIPADKIVAEDYGRVARPLGAETSRWGPRNRLGYFGQITPFKGVDVLLEAMRLLAQRRVAVHLTIHGANLELSGREYQRRLERLLAETRDVATMAGSYDRAELPYLMAAIDWVVVPSVWWENSPLVIQEAFAHGRPVICSDIGGMAEKAREGIGGVHFPAGDAAALSRAIQAAVSEPALWESVHRAIPHVHSMTDHVAQLGSRYTALLNRRKSVAA